MDATIERADTLPDGWYRGPSVALVSETRITSALRSDIGAADDMPLDVLADEYDGKGMPAIASLIREFAKQ